MSNPNRYFIQILLHRLTSYDLFANLNGVFASSVRLSDGPSDRPTVRPSVRPTVRPTVRPCVQSVRQNNNVFV